MHKFELKQKEGTEGPMIGANSELLLDGQPLRGVTYAKVEIGAGGVAVVTLKLIGHVNVVGQFEPVNIKQEVVDLVPKDKVIVELEKEEVAEAKE